MKRVLIFTYYWPPSGGAGVQRWLKFSKFLPEFGWEPIVITVDPKKATYPVLDDSLHKEIGSDVRVIHTDSTEWFSVYKKVSGSGDVPYAGFANDSKATSFKQKAARFFRGNFFIPDPRKGWNKHALKAARNLINETKIDCIITSGPPHSTQLIGLDLAEEFSIPWIADFRDPWTDIYYYKQFYPTYFAHRTNLRMEKSVLNNASGVTTVSPFIEALLKGKVTKDRSRVRVITNGFDPDNFKNKSSNTGQRFVITYIGTMADIYPMDSFLEACRDLVKEYPDVLLRFIGTISNSQREKILKLPEDNTELVPYVNHDTAIDYLYETTILLLIIPTHSSSKGIVTGKIFEYLGVGKPILYLGPVDGDGAEMIRQGESGAIMEADDIVKIRETLQSWKKSCPQVQANENFSRKKLTQDLARILDEMASS